MARPNAQTKKVYDAENNSGIFAHPEDMIPNIKDVQAWVDSIVASEYIRSNYPNMIEVEVRDGRGRRSGHGRGYTMAGAWFGVIKMPRFSRTKQYILHEVAHAICGAKYGPHGHGQKFIEVYLGLVNEFLGKIRHDTLANALVAHGAIDRSRVTS